MHYRKSNQMLAIDEYHFTLGGKKGEKFHIEASSASRWPSTECNSERQAIKSSSGFVSTVKHPVAPSHFHLMKFGQNQCCLVCSSFLIKRQAAAQQPCLHDSDRIPPASCTHEESWESMNMEPLVGYVWKISRVRQMKSPETKEMAKQINKMRYMLRKER